MTESVWKIGRHRGFGGVLRKNYSIWPLLSACIILLTGISLLCQEPVGALLEGTRALNQGSYEKAASLAANFAKAHPRMPAARILLARAEMAQGKYLLAYQELQEALRLQPKNLDTLYYLGQLCNLLSQIEYKQLHALAPDSARVHQLQADFYRLQEDTAKAEEEYQAALKADPRSVEILVALGDLTRSEFRFDEALSYYSRAYEINPRNYESAYGLGACYHFQQEPQKAIEYFRRALAIDPDSAAARLALGDALLKADQSAAAVTELKAAVALEPKMRQAYSLLGRAQQKLGLLREAAESFKKAQELIQAEMESRQDILNAGDATSAPSAPAQGSHEKPDTDH